MKRWRIVWSEERTKDEMCSETQMMAMDVTFRFLKILDIMGVRKRKGVPQCEKINS